ncbi:MAG TPA: hypothetical protein VIM75_04850, partial [Ohtaekwangia sp.]|uniref:hypothetical protein n=1 Tax=Ohtaekwangia sp. TaxID=2066019 RepID=UPI002F928BA6
MESTISIKNSTTQPVESAQVQLVPTRSKIEGLKSDSASVTRISDFGFMLHFGTVLNKGAEVDVKVIYEGEPVSLSYVNFSTKVEHVEFKSFRESISKPIDFDADLINANYRKRIAFIATIQNPIIKKAQEFFAFYDHQSLPPLVERNPDLSATEKKKRIQIVVNSLGILTNRVLIRGKYGAQGKVPPVSEMPNYDHDSIVYLSELQKNIFDKYYLVNGSLDLDAIETAFELFTNGDLRLIDPLGIRNGEPDSAFEFSFAEWALLAIQNNVDADYWKQIAPKLIKSQVIFMQVYQPNKVGPYLYTE